MTDQLVKDYVDKALIYLKKIDLMRLPYRDIPHEMIDKHGTQSQDCYSWQPIPSVVTATEISLLETKIGVFFPRLYKDLLQYKHFYDLEIAADITFYRHCSRAWNNDLLDCYFKGYEPNAIIHRGFIPFGNYSDWGIVCFDTNKMVNNDCPIVMFDHELLYDNPVPFEILYPSFQSMLLERLEQLDRVLYG